MFVQQRRYFIWGWICCLFLGAIVLAQPVGAVEAPSNQTAESLTIHLGTPDGALRFEPNHLTFIAGKRYTLILDNPSPVKHYFTAKDFADVIWSQKVEVAGVEIKGAIHELELKPQSKAEWVFIPQKPGHYELHCSISGHSEAGMIGEIAIVDPA